MSPSLRVPCPPISVAPMLDRTDRHFRWVLRQISRRTLLYSEMVISSAVLRGDRNRLIGFDPIERPLVLQLGGDQASDLATCARIAQEMGYDEVNLNVGCPSERVQAGRFGVCLMARPETVADCVRAMRSETSIPITVKHRIGFDDRDRYSDMVQFVDTVARAGCDRFTVHARKAWLSGLSPKENREIPPLQPELVHKLKSERPELAIELNGGIPNLDVAAAHLRAGPDGRTPVDGVMIGRAVWEDPWVLRSADSRFFDAADPEPLLADLIRAAHRRAREYLDMDPQLRMGPLVRPLFCLANGRKGARSWRRILTERAVQSPRDPNIILEALAALSDGPLGTEDVETTEEGAERTTRSTPTRAAH